MKATVAMIRGRRSWLISFADSGVSSTAITPVGAATSPAQGGGVADLGLQPQRHQQVVGEEHGIAQA